MSNINLCRVCLASNTRMHNIANTRYQEIFEKLSTKLCTEDGRPETMCYICFSQLQNCCKFVDMSRKAEEILTQFSLSGIELSEDTVAILDRKFVRKISWTPFQYLSINDSSGSQLKLQIKEEPTGNIVQYSVNENTIAENEQPSEKEKQLYEKQITIIVKEEPISESEQVSLNMNAVTEEETPLIDKQKIIIVKEEPISENEQVSEKKQLPVKEERIKQELIEYGDGEFAADFEVEGTSIECSFKRMIVLDTWLSIKDSKSELERMRRVFQALMQLLPDVQNFINDDLEKRVANLCTRFVANWKQVSRSYSRMVSKHGDWLNKIEVCVLPIRATAESRDTRRPAAEASTSTQQQQHRKDIEESSKRSKRRRLAELSKVDSSAINSLLDDSSRSNVASLNFNTDEVLPLISETKLTEHQYLMVKDFINAKSPNVFPSYPKVLEAKKRCYLSEEFKTESSAEIELHTLLDHTECRILESQNNVLNNIDLNKEFVLIGKWSFDGSTGHSEYEQCFEG